MAEAEVTRAHRLAVALADLGVVEFIDLPVHYKAWVDGLNAEAAADWSVTRLAQLLADAEAHGAAEAEGRLKRLEDALERLSRFKWELADKSFSEPCFSARQVEEPGEPTHFLVHARSASGAVLALEEKLRWTLEKGGEGG